MNIDYKKQAFSLATFWVGIYYLRDTIIFAQEYRGLPPDYLMAFLYFVLTVLSFSLFAKRKIFVNNKVVFWIYIVLGLTTFLHFVNVILPNYY